MAYTDVRRQRPAMAVRQVSLAVVLSLACTACMNGLSGCGVDFDYPLDDDGRVVDASPYTGMWVITLGLGKREVEGATIAVEQAGPNVLTMRTTVKWGRTLRFEGRLARIGGSVFLSCREVVEDGGPDYPWTIVRLETEYSGKTVIAKSMRLIDARRYVESGTVKGVVMEAEMSGDTVAIEAGANELRAFVATHAGEFETPMIVLEKAG